MRKSRGPLALLCNDFSRSWEADGVNRLKLLFYIKSPNNSLYHILPYDTQNRKKFIINPEGSSLLTFRIRTYLLFMVFFRKQIETCLSEMGIKEEFYGMVLWATMLSIRCVRKEIKTTLPLSMSEQPWWWRVGSGWQAHSAFPTPPN